MVAQGLCMGLQMHVCMGQACLAGPLGTQAHTPSMMPAAWGQVGCRGEVLSLLLPGPLLRKA